MRALAVFTRLLRGFKRDKRTLALMMVAPVLVLSLLWVIFQSDNYRPRVATVDVPDHLVRAMRNQDATVRPTDRATADGVRS